MDRYIGLCLGLRVDRDERLWFVSLVGLAPHSPNARRAPAVVALHHGAVRVTGVLAGDAAGDRADDRLVRPVAVPSVVVCEIGPDTPRARRVFSMARRAVALNLEELLTALHHLLGDT